MAGAAELIGAFAFAIQLRGSEVCCGHPPAIDRADTADADLYYTTLQHPRTAQNSTTRRVRDEGNVPAIGGRCAVGKDGAADARRGPVWLLRKGRLAWWCDGDVCEPYAFLLRPLRGM